MVIYAYKHTLSIILGSSFQTTKRNRTSCSDSYAWRKKYNNDTTIRINIITLASIRKKFWQQRGGGDALNIQKIFCKKWTQICSKAVGLKFGGNSASLAPQISHNVPIADDTSSAQPLLCYSPSNLWVEFFCLFFIWLKTVQPARVQTLMYSHWRLKSSEYITTRRKPRLQNFYACSNQNFLDVLIN